ncbi:MAG TPA: hypothetical protein VHL09_12070 [Dehalococcoidia bacterium]|nr:hypothetical protein [Dehalococcoidia bacterium]
MSVQPTPASPQGTPASPQAAGGSVPDTAPTQAGAPRPTPQPPPPLGQPGREVFTASFSDPARTGLQFLGPPSTSSGVEAGAYWISVGAQWQAGWAAAPGSQGDFIAETDVAPSGNSQERGHGLAFRINQDGNRPPSYYLFWMNPAGPQYALHRVDQGQFNELIAWRRHQALRGEGEPNKMTVRAKGSTLDLYINEQPVASATDDTIKEGRVALYLSAWSIPGVRTDFLSFKVWQAN